MKKSFSERLGIVEATATLQVGSMNDDLRNSIWNLLFVLFNSGNNRWTRFAISVARDFRKVTVDDLPTGDFACRNWLKSYFFSLCWHRKYDFVEFVVCNFDRILSLPESRRQVMEKMFNDILEREMSGYRFVAGELAPISDSAETAEVADAIEMTLRMKLDGARQHLQTALSLLAKKPDPDYRNSIKESISAVESVAKVLGKKDSEGLAGALNELAKKTNLHGALKAGFIKLYGYASEEGGIRHAIVDEPNVGLDEAKFMVVACSAFVNFLISKAEAAGLLTHDVEGDN